MARPVGDVATLTFGRNGARTWATALPPARDRVNRTCAGSTLFATVAVAIPTLSSPSYSL